MIVCSQHCRYCGSRNGAQLTADGWQSLFACEHPRHPTAIEGEPCPDFAMRPASPTSQPALAAGHAPSDRQSAETPFFLPGRAAGHDRPIDLAGLYRNGAAFLIAGGPSLLRVPLKQLVSRGVAIVSYNNNPASLPAPLRPHIWLHTDTVAKFHDSLWRDPSVLKFSPLREWRSERKRGAGGAWKNVRRRVATGFEPLGSLAVDLPGVIGYARNSTLRPDQWLHEGTINRGNDQQSSRRNGLPHVINSLFSALRIVYSLGFATLYLVGCDFYMDADQPYAFGQAKRAAGVRANNEAFAALDALLTLLAPRLQQAGLAVYNTNRHSRLTAFAHCDFEQAVQQVASQFEQQLDARGWYD